MEFISIKKNQDIAEFLKETNSLHDGYIISVEYRNDGISNIGGVIFQDSNSSSLKISILVTSISNTVVELEFEHVVEWQVKSGRFEIVDTAVAFEDDGHIVWVDDTCILDPQRKEGSYVVAGAMKWRKYTDVQR